MLFSRSKYNHIARYDNSLVREMKGHGYQEVSLMDCLEESKAKIHAYKVIAPIDEKKAASYNKRMKGVKYDIQGAMFSEVEKWTVISWLFKKKANDDEMFCSEEVVRFFQDQELFPLVNPNLFSPQEVLERLIRLKVINPNYETWKEKYH